MSASGYGWGRLSQSRLSTCHGDLQRLMTAALHHPDCPLDMTIVFGHRSNAEQAELYAQGRTKPGKIVTNARPGQSRHNSWPSDAVDVIPYVNGSGSWSWDHINPMADHIKRVAADLGIEVTWGGDWRMKDGAHWELPR
jgi:peptidoglycan L-alanyl-D-glutamate endopeptidase CwlK